MSNNVAVIFTYMNKLARLPAPQINSVTFSPDGRRVGVATGHGQVLVWDIDTGDTVFKVECPRGIGARYMCFSPDGKHVVAASAADDVAVWELESAKHVWQVKVPGLVMVRALSDVPRLSGDGDVTACTEGWLHVMLGPMQGSFGVGHLEGDFLQVGAEQATHMFTIMAGATKGATFMEMRIPARDVAG